MKRIQTFEENSRTNFKKKKRGRKPKFFPCENICTLQNQREKSKTIEMLKKIKGQSSKLYPTPT